MAQKHELHIEEPSTKRLKVENNIAELPAVERTEGDQEQNVGITAYASPDVPGFTCIVKQRYTDFLVNEITPEGQVVHLTELPDGRRRQQDEIQANPPKEEDPPAENGAADATRPQPEVQVKAETSTVPSPEPKGKPVKDAQESTAPAKELSSEQQAAVDDVFGEQVRSKIVDLYTAVLKYPQRKPRDHATVLSEVITEKAKRTQAHIAIRQIFDSKLQTEMLQDKPGVIAIKAAPAKQTRDRGRGQQGTGKDGMPKGKLGWEELGGEYLHFTLYKENKDTMEVLYFIASQLKVAAKNFQFAGTKDRRGVTVQRVAVWRVHANRIANLNRMAKGWVANAFEYKKHGLELGELTGNEFTLTLRDCRFVGDDGIDEQKRLELAKNIVIKAADAFKTRGFINYYGLQRFGSFSTGTHVTGLKMLQNDLEGAINCILTYSDTLLPENQDASGTTKVPQDDITRADTIRTWRKTGEIGYLPRRFQAELAIMQYLSRKEKRTGKMIQANDWQGALMTIQRNLRMMYVHAYQSLVWNTVAGKRWEMHADQVVEGDLVIVGEKDGEATESAAAEVDQDGELVVRPAEDDQAASADNAYTRARPLSKEEAQSGKYDIFDVVLPLPGYDVVYPSNAIGKFYEEFMGSETGGKLDPHNMRRAWKDASLSGGYRKMMARPLDGAEVEVMEYEGETEQLVQTDLEKLKQAAEAENPAGVEEAAKGSGDVKMEEDGSGPGPLAKKIAVVLKFQLASSQYATMAIRELTKGGGMAYKPDYSTAR